MSKPETPIPIETLTTAAAAPYGWMLGKPLPATRNGVIYASPGSDFWQQHLFSAGAQGELEILWVTYRTVDPVVHRMETHLLTEQAVVPLVGRIIQIVAASNPSGDPDLATTRAFAIGPGQGICMRPGTWHATRAVDGEATCLMLTRRSTTVDLVEHLVQAKPASESKLTDIDTIRLIQ